MKCRHELTMSVRCISLCVIFFLFFFLCWLDSSPCELIGCSYLDQSWGSVHIVTVSMAVSRLISPTTPTHIAFACVCLRLTIISLTTLHLFYSLFIALPLIWKTRPSNPWCNTGLCVSAWGRAWVKLLSSDGSEEETARAEQQQGEILGCVFSSPSLVFPPFLFS